MAKLKQVPISPYTILEICKGGSFEVNRGSLPKDAKLVNCYMAPERNEIMVVIQSEEFEEVLEGEIIPLCSGDILIKKLS